MGRRKPQFVDDGDSSDEGGADGGGAYEGDFADPDDRRGLRPQRKRRKRFADDYGYDEDEDGDGASGSQNRSGRPQSRPSNFLKGQKFVPATSAASADAPSPPSRSSAPSSSGSSEHSSTSGGEEEDDDDDLEQKAFEMARQPSSEQEELQLSQHAGIGSKGGPTEGERNTKRAGQSTRGGLGFRPASFVSSRHADRVSPSSQTRKEDVADGFEHRGGIGSGKGSSPQGSASQSASQRHVFPEFDSSSMHESGLPSDFGRTTQSNVAASDTFRKVQQQQQQAPTAETSSHGRKRDTFKPAGAAATGFNPAAMLAAMGWTGGGLGQSGQGMLNPIEVKLRPERAGIAFGGIREKTKQAKEEARRRGEEVSEDEDEKKARLHKERKASHLKTSKPQGAGDASAEDLRKAWTRERKPRKPRVEHRTYEQIIEEAGSTTQGDAGLGQILDARTGDVREVASISAALARHSVPSSDSSRLPELRHNLRLITDNSRKTLDSLARDGAGIAERRRWLKREQEESSRRAAQQRIELIKIQKAVELVKEIEAMGTRALADSTLELQAFDPIVGRIDSEDQAEISKWHLDEALCGALVPSFKRFAMRWAPLELATEADVLKPLMRWRKVLLGDQTDHKTVSALDRYGHPSDRRQKSAVATSMRPFEALMWHLWLPKVRSALNNDWRPHHPRAAVDLLSAWRPLLPTYLWDNVVDQILLPKIQRTTTDWEAKSSKVSLHHLIFPWLSLLKDRMDEVIAEARRRLRSTLKAWRIGEPSDGSAEPETTQDASLRHEVGRWRELFPSRHDFDSMMLTTVVPKLSSHLNKKLLIDPRQQVLAPLQRVLAWTPFLRSSMLSKILETEFLPPWLRTLHSWLLQPGADLGEVAQWYSWWKDWFQAPQQGVDLSRIKGLQRGFDKGIALIHRAIELGDVDMDERKRKLVLPDLAPGPSIPKAEPREKEKARASRVAVEPEVSFKGIVEERLTSCDLVLLSLHRSHPDTGKPLYRATKDPGFGTSRGLQQGAIFYLDDDVVWLQQPQRKDKPSSAGNAHDFAPVSIEELIKAAR
ncbi:unnamed protein product [Jaminaea pallidilutea]